MLYFACDEIWYSKNNSTAHVVRISIQKNNHRSTQMRAHSFHIVYGYFLCTQQQREYFILGNNIIGKSI